MPLATTGVKEWRYQSRARLIPDSTQIAFETTGDCAQEWPTELGRVQESWKAGARHSPTVVNSAMDDTSDMIRRPKFSNYLTTDRPADVIDLRRLNA